MHGEKIRLIREMRGLSQENIAAKLGIAQNTYSKVERNQSKLESGMLVKIADILQVSPMDILSNQPAIINFHPTDAVQLSVPSKQVENLAIGQIELFDKIISAKNEEINRLIVILDRLLSGNNYKPAKPNHSGREDFDLIRRD